MTATFGPDGKTNFAYCWVAAAGPRVATRIPPQQPQTLYVCGASARVRSSLYSRTWLEAAASPAGAKVDFVSRRGSKTASRNGRPVRCCWPKVPKDELAGRRFPHSKIPWFFKKLRVLCTFIFDPSKTLYFCNRKPSNTIKKQGFRLAKAAKPRTGRLQTVFFSSWSLPAAPGHRFPRAVWLLGARPLANLAPGGVCE